MTTDNTESANLAVPSPCIRNCCLDNNDICIGCFRSISEIVGWHTATDDEKSQILIQSQLRQQADIG
ncbi:DUF1289 domain-containing protein [Alteromonadaceae bacterium BrNp21-10]|nr:DUF1289 domain-containing protein [Alteromonadaceae bacterium BrNp21-10]